MTLTDITQKTQKPHIYICDTCDFKTSNKNDYSRHILTPKHIKQTDFSNNEQTLTKKTQQNSTLICDNCEKKYKSRVGLWSHKKKCKIVNNKNEPVQTTELTTMFVTLMKQNNEFKELIMEQNQKIIEKDNELKNVIIELSN